MAVNGASTRREFCSAGSVAVPKNSNETTAGLSLDNG
jgi:hypothetical protein